MINDLCDHWLLGNGLEERSEEEARFVLKEQAIRTMVPYFLLPYGRALFVVEPELLRERMVTVAEQLSEHYRTRP